jgi:formate--tetrahydrofolate ligase
MADYVVTEAGFGADLGAEKFIDIKCRKSGLRPDAVVLVVTLRALKFHGGVDLKELNQENVEAVDRGFANLERHIKNVRKHYGLPCIVAINHFTYDTEAEIAMLQQKLTPYGVPAIVSRHWAEGGKGAADLARMVVEMTDNNASDFRFLYEDNTPLWDKMKTIATKIYGASDIIADTDIRNQIKKLQESYGHYPVCVAKTQYSFSTDPKLRGAPSDHVVKIREVRLAAGAEFIVMVCGDVMTMPGLPKVPSAENIDIDADGKVMGLF